MSARRKTHAAVTAATVAAIAAVLGGTIALAAAVPGPGTVSDEAKPATESPRTLAFVTQLAPPPGAAVLAIAGLIAIRRKRRSDVQGH